MKILMEPTEHIVTVDGVECRVWNAVTEQDTQCFVLVHRIAVKDGDDAREFETELQGRSPHVIMPLEVIE